MSLYMKLLLIILMLMLVILRYSQMCRLCESFVPGAYEKPICDSHYMTSNPFKYKKNDDKSEFDDKYFNRVFKESLPEKLNNEGSIDLPLENRVLNWINTLTKLNQIQAKKFEIYEFEKMTEDTFLFTLYRENKNHAKVIEAKIVPSKEDVESKVIKKLRVIGFKNSYDAISTLNKKGYDSLTFDSLEDRWQQKVEEKLVPDEVTASEELNFEEVNL